ncbi:MAG TPA: hypothetical protein VI584_02285 [Nitrospiria bacterium]|nr:hypothetical protein [Nitrospiria bacterium]
MKRYNAKMVIALITGVSIFTLFCGTIFACLIPISIDSNKDLMAGCASNGNQNGDNAQETCYSTEFTHAQSHIKLPQDIKEIKGSALPGLYQALYPARAILIQRIANAFFSNVILQKIDIFIEYQNLRL